MDEFIWMSHRTQKFLPCSLRWTRRPLTSSKSEVLDFKPWQDPKESKKVAVEYAACLANTSGGVVVFGVKGKSQGALFVPGGSAMQILVPWKPVVLLWGLLSGMTLVGFVASSVLQGKDPFAPGAIMTQPPSVKSGVAQAGRSKHSHKAARTPSQ